MAHSYNVIARYPDMRKTIVDVVCDAAYPANGYVLDPKQLGMLSVDHVNPIISTGEAVLPVYTAATAKLKIYKTGAATSGVFLEIANTDVTASTKVRCEVTGTPIA
jgi:hypothetical protein